MRERKILYHGIKGQRRRRKSSSNTNNDPGEHKSKKLGLYAKMKQKLIQTSESFLWNKTRNGCFIYAVRPKSKGDEKKNSTGTAT
jgi:hypothetical protein